MYCVRKVLEDLWWVGGNDRRLAMFEGVYAVPNGSTYLRLPRRPPASSQ